ncbi:hypothetical protein VTL71DRAFT_874 [Oculimacula yallundae]|uniref:Heterokaryon incompatibility domain-containing protein n=1 Tax=Oculimacula yallundae TaxID=86028 RepID=A0ABR4D3K3_9HELO
MRLLSYSDNGEIILTEFFGDKIPADYAILSHTWEEHEVSFSDMLNGSGTMKAGYRKIGLCGEQARRDGLEYFWVDTCCIDKSSSAELSEAINSMFQWYKKATICYAYLSDVLTVEPTAEEFGQSRWFERGWTLQELLAPKKIHFYTNQWNRIRFKNELNLKSTISGITSIHIEYLNGKSLSQASIAERMSWASSRKTTREEDVAYSLLGIFGVHIPLLYGEGGIHAFIRLQEELLRTTNDHSIFLWDFIQGTDKWSIYHHALAPSPIHFQNGGDIVCCDFGHSVSHSSVTNAGILIKLPILFPNDQPYIKAVFQCRRKDDFSNAIALPLFYNGRGAYARINHPHMLVQQNTTRWMRIRVKEIYLETRPGMENMEDMIIEVADSRRYS